MCRLVPFTYSSLLVCFLPGPNALTNRTGVNFLTGTVNLYRKVQTWGQDQLNNIIFSGNHNKRNFHHTSQRLQTCVFVYDL